VDGLLHLGLTNAAWAAVLALAAALGSRWLRRYPAVVHALWLLVLLKLATPSLVQLPLPWGNVQPQENVAKREPERSIEVLARPRSLAPTREVRTSPRKLTGRTNPSSGNDQELAIRSEPIVTTAKPWPWRQIAVALWLFGMTAWWVVIGLSSYRFHRLLRLSRPAPDELCERLAQVAARLGLRRVPMVSLVMARVPPMVWAGLAGAPRLVLPEELWSRFDSAQQDAVMAHELAHLKRRDHWVRRLEAIVLGLYWWNPVAWWARRELERAEEACCDAWVVWALPTAAGAYVEALVATAVYLSGLRLTLPVGASGAGRVLPLTRRLNMILSDQSRSALARNLARAVLVVGVLALPFLPSLAAGRTPGAPDSTAMTIAEITDQPKQDTPSAGRKPEAKNTATTKEPASDPLKTLRKVRVCQPMVREISDALIVAGRLDALHQVQLKGRVSGQLETVDCRPGQTVKKGDVLFEIEPRPYRAEVDKATAEVRLAQSRMKGLRTKLANAQRLVQQGTTGPGHVTEIEGEIEATEAARQAAGADLDLARLKLESTKVTSPIVGKISGSVLAAGNVVVADTTVLATIVSFDPIYVTFSVPQAAIMRLNRLIREGKIKGELKSGYPITVSLVDGDGFSHPAKADSADIVVDNLGTFRCHAVLPNPDGFLLPGLNVFVNLVTSAPHTALVLPERRSRRGGPDSGAGHFIYVVNSENVVKQHVLRVNSVDDQLWAVEEGLRADEWIVLDGLGPELLGTKVDPEKVAFPFPGKPVEDKPAPP
jgi:RND family efflux transporter MFP subunit